MTAPTARAGTRKPATLPSAMTIIKKIALADGCLAGHPEYMTKYQIIGLAKAWLSVHKVLRVGDKLQVRRIRSKKARPSDVVGRTGKWLTLRSNEIQRANEAAYHGDIDGDFDY